MFKKIWIPFLLTVLLFNIFYLYNYFSDFYYLYLLIIFTHPDIALKEIRLDPGNCSGRIAAVSRRPRDRSV